MKEITFTKTQVRQMLQSVLDGVCTILYPDGDFSINLSCPSNPGMETLGKVINNIPQICREGLYARCGTHLPAQRHAGRIVQSRVGRSSTKQQSFDLVLGQLSRRNRNVLCVLLRSPGWLKSAEICESCNLDAKAVQAVVYQLLDRNLISRKKAPKGSRTKYIYEANETEIEALEQELGEQEEGESPSFSDEEESEEDDESEEESDEESEEEAA
jgi:predicted transcriptional regulator